MEYIKKEYQRLLDSKEFKHEGFFCSAFIMSDIKDLNSAAWQIDFFDKENNTMTSYLMESKIKIAKNLEIFKDEANEIKKINLIDLKINLEDAVKIANEYLERNKEKAVKIIIIIQQTSELIWNISYVTDKFNLTNIKINAKNGKVMEQTSGSLLSFKN